MHTRNIVLLIIALVLAFGAYMLTKKRKDTFVGDFSIDSGFYTVDHDQFGGSGVLSDPINQSG